MLGLPGVVTGRGAPARTIEAPRFLHDPALRAIALQQSVTVEDMRFERADGSPFP